MKPEAEAGEELLCGISGRQITIGSDEWDVDHQDPPSFAQIVNEFLDDRQMAKADVEVRKRAGVKPRLADDQLRRISGGAQRGCPAARGAQVRAPAHDHTVEISW